MVEEPKMSMLAPSFTPTILLPVEVLFELTGNFTTSPFAFCPNVNAGSSVGTTLAVIPLVALIINFSLWIFTSSEASPKTS